MPALLPAWADVLILLAVPLIMLAVVLRWGGGEPDNTVVHHSGDEDEPPDGSGRKGPEDVMLAA